MRKSLLVSHLVTATLFFCVGFLVADKKTVEEHTQDQTADEPLNIIETLNNENAVLRRQVGEFESIIANLETTTESEPAAPEKSVDEKLAGNFSARIATNYRDLGRRNYSDLFEDLMYSDEQVNAFLELWLNHAVEWINKENAIRGTRSADELSYQEKLDIQERLNENRVAMLAQQAEKIQEAFPNDYDSYVAYEKTVHERAQISRLTQSFEDQLDRYSKDQLVTMFAEAGEKVGLVDQRYVFDADLEERLTLTEKRDKDFLDNARSYLTGDQFDTLSGQLANQRKRFELFIQLEF